MTRTLVKLSTTISGIAQLMGMTKEEISFFSKLGDVRNILTDYNYSILTGKKAAAKLGDIKKNLRGDETIFADGLDALITKLTY